jgi:hypothetical protein
MEQDPTIERIRDARRLISEKCGHDPKKLVEYYMQLEKEKYVDRLVKQNKPQTKAKQKKSESQPPG